MLFRSLEGHAPLDFASGHTAAPADLNNVRWVSLSFAKTRAECLRSIETVASAGRQDFRSLGGDGLAGPRTVARTSRRLTDTAMATT